MANVSPRKIMLVQTKICAISQTVLEKNWNIVMLIIEPLHLPKELLSNLQKMLLSWQKLLEIPLGI